MGQLAPNSIDGAAHFGDCKGAVNRSRARVCGPRREAAYARRMIVCLGEAIVDLVCDRALVGEPERELTLRARRAARDRGAKILFDPNLRPNRWRDMGLAARICREMMDGAFVVRANEWEARELTGESEPAAAAQAFCEEG